MRTCNMASMGNMPRQNVTNVKEKDIMHGDVRLQVVSMRSKRIQQMMREIKIEIDSVGDEWRETLEINGEEKEFKLDTGARVTAIQKHHYSADKHGTLLPPKYPLYGPGRQHLDVEGTSKENWKSEKGQLNRMFMLWPSG